MSPIPMIKVSFMQLNIRGIWDPEKRKVFQKLLEKNKPSIVLLSELKVSNFSTITTRQKYSWFPGYTLFCENCRCGILVLNSIAARVQIINIPGAVHDNDDKEKMKNVFHYCAVKIVHKDCNFVVISGYRSPSGTVKNVCDIFQSLDLSPN